MVSRPTLQSRSVRAGALGAVILAAAAIALALHRTGHTQGDDFALYLRQARSLFDGDVGAVVADNRFTVLNSGSSFSPIAYPWGWPLLLAPFVQQWGLDYDRLKVLEVGIFCLWLVLLHGIVRRRMGRLIALGMTAVIGTAPLFLVHTDQLLTEFPHLAAVALVLWWYDRVRAKSPLITASTKDLVVLGTLVTVAFNMRRESIVLLGVIAVVQAVELIAASSEGSVARVDLRGRLASVFRLVQSRWRMIVAPYAAFVATAIGFQLLLPTMLLPDNGNSAKFIGARFSDYAGALTLHLGLGRHPALGVLIVGVAIVGAVIGVRRRPDLNLPLVVLAILSALVIGTHLRMVDRYWFQVTVWVLYFATVAIVTAFQVLLRQRRRLVVALGVTPLVLLVVAHAVVLPGDIADARQFNADGRVQFGPAHPDVIPIYDAVGDLTPPTAVIAFFRARTMTLLTDRRAIQSTNIDQIIRRADYFAQRREKSYWQPDLTPFEAKAMGLEIVWSDSMWILWRLPLP